MRFLDSAQIFSIISGEQQLPVGVRLGKEGVGAMGNFKPLHIRAQDESSVSRG